MTEPTSSDEVEALIAEFRSSGMRELHVRCDGFELYLSSDPHAPGIGAASAVSEQAANPASPRPDGNPVAERQAAPVTAAAGQLPDELPAGAIIVRAPYLGTFYRAPKPGAPAYVDLGSRVMAETELCLVEVMKLFTAVRAGVTGRIHAVLAVDGQLVAADQPLFVVVPD